MVAAFRVSELQMLLQFANKNKSGKKTELQARAMDLLRRAVHAHNGDVLARIRQLHRQRYASDQQSQQENQLQQQAPPLPPQPQPNYSSMPVLTALSANSSSASSSSAAATAVSSQVVANSPRADVTFKALPFFDIVDELVAPCALCEYSITRHTLRN